MSRGATYDRVYAALKRQLLTGRFGPGDALEPASLSETLNASVTPVRDALHHLAGERLVDSARHDGFRMPIVTEAGLRDLYEWNGQVLDLALRASPDPPPAVAPTPSATGDDDAASSTAALLHQVAGWSGNREHAATIAQLNSRLHAARMLESRFIASADADLHALVVMVEQRDPRALRQQLGGYHRVRLRAVPAITAMLMARYGTDPPAS